MFHDLISLIAEINDCWEVVFLLFLKNVVWHILELFEVLFMFCLFRKIIWNLLAKLLDLTDNINDADDIVIIWRILHNVKQRSFNRRAFTYVRILGSIFKWHLALNSFLRFFFLLVLFFLFSFYLKLEINDDILILQHHDHGFWIRKSFCLI